MHTPEKEGPQQMKMGLPNVRLQSNYLWSISPRLTQYYLDIGQENIHYKLVNGVYRCIICGKSYPIKNPSNRKDVTGAKFFVRRHVETHLNPKLYTSTTCETCQKSFVDMSTLKRHQVCVILEINGTFTQHTMLHLESKTLEGWDDLLYCLY